MTDGGWPEPQSLLYARLEYHRPTVHKLIAERKLAPFYLGLQDFEDDWDAERIVAALDDAEQQATRNLKDAHAAAIETANEAEAAQLSAPSGTRKHKESVTAFNAAVLHRERLAEVLKIREKKGGGALQTTNKTDQAKLYVAKALECPICFLYYPPNMVRTRCCDQPICTECFIQIKRADPTPTHLESEPAACPFCMEPNFGVVYDKPVVRPPVQPSPTAGSGSSSSDVVPGRSASERKPRRKSFAHTEKEVVTTDMVHPDWESKLEAMKAAVARRANRRIVFRQVGDRLIPVGITSSHAGDGSNPTMATTTLPPNFLSQIAAALDASNENGGSGSGGRSRRGSRSLRRRGGGQSDEVVALLESLGLGGGPDLEEMMVQEAMRLSQLEEEERQKKAREEEAKKAGQAGGAGAEAEAPTSSVPQTPRTTEWMLTEAVGEDIHRSHVLTSATPSTSTSTSASQGTPPVLAPIPHVDLDLPTSPSALAPPESVASSSAAPTAAAPELAPVSSTISRTSEASSTIPLTPGQGYQQLEDESDADVHNPAASAQSPKHGSEQQQLERNGGIGTLVDV
ncbi:zinc finger, RING-type domain containing protein [Rhodotorula toruloides]|uniref:Zinc finger, RING-type domain containing protein n=1 Tax=Rhodotorula toruloides TaxID=5286 RepID=A0A511KI59_RHOTO|nr:zinc finger, RING-type domain containing protein [Rhodotorula toruloides]